MLKALADEHIVLALVLGLRSRGMDVVTVQDLNQRSADDAELLDRAYREQRIVLTNDHDFLALAAEHALRQAPFAPIFYWLQQQRTVGHLLRKILQPAVTLTYTEVSSQVFFL